MNKWIAVGLIGLLIMSCTHKKDTSSDCHTESTETDSLKMVKPKYAEGYEVNYKKDFIELNIHDPQKEESAEYKYALVNRGSNPNNIPKDYIKIKIPIRSVICMTSLQLSNFIKLGMENKVVGITSTRHLFNPIIKKQIKEGITSKIGIEGNFDNEVIIAMNPDLILISPFKRGGYEALKEVDIPLIPHLGYKELTPLGQAEWIKLIGLLTGEEKLANQKFSEIETRYNELRSLTSQEKNIKRPIIFSGEMRGGNWYAVGGESFLAQLFKDAGADYFLKDDKRSGGVTLDFETVYSQADDADYWRIVNSFHGDFSYDALKAMDSRYADFKAFKNKGIIYCNMNDVPFYESMPTEPEVILADLLHIFHPELLPDHKAVYYHLLK